MTEGESASQTTRHNVQEEILGDHPSDLHEGHNPGSRCGDEDTSELRFLGSSCDTLAVSGPGLYLPSTTAAVMPLWGYLLTGTALSITLENILSLQIIS